MPENLTDKIAIGVLRTFLLRNGIYPSDDWNAEDPNCVYNSNGYRIYTLSGVVAPEISDNLDTLFEKLAAYLDNQNKCDVSLKFFPFDLEVYDCPCGCSTAAYISIYTVA